MKIDPRNIYQLKGTVQHYTWGGFEYISQLLQMNNAAHHPFAEYWMGAHHSAASHITDEEGSCIELDKLFNIQPALLGEAVKNKFHQLPYLLKILDVREMLSVQVHPGKEAAQNGFAEEEERGIAVKDEKRNYKDTNHKPEIMVALSDFWLLHGFKPADKLKQMLGEIPQFRSLLSIFENEGYKGLYSYVMDLPQHEAEAMLLPLVQKEVRRRSFHESEKTEPGYWVGEYYLNKSTKKIDKGVFAIYFLNLVHLEAGQGIFQAAGIPHAYLQGQNVELMANSDNVLRGGLTNKHIDVQELIKNTRFEAVIPEIITGDKTGYETVYRTPVNDFSLSKLEMHAQQTYRVKSTSADILICMKGAVKVSAQNTMNIEKGEVFICFAGNEYLISSTTESLLFRASVPV